MSLSGTLTNMKKVNQTKYVHGASNSNGTEIKSVVLEGHIAGERERWHSMGMMQEKSTAGVDTMGNTMI